MPIDTVEEAKSHKTKLNETMIKALCSIIARGNYAITACNICGIDESTYYDWINQGKNDIDAGQVTLHSKLVHAIKKADGESEAHLTDIVRVAAESNPMAWAAAMTQKERRWRERWGRSEQLDIRETKHVQVTHVEVIMDPSQTKQLPEAKVT